MDIPPEFQQYSQVFSDEEAQRLPKHQPWDLFFFFFFFFFFGIVFIVNSNKLQTDTLRGLMGPLRRIPARQAGVTLVPGHPFASTPTSIGSLWECADIACNRGYISTLPTISYMVHSVRRHEGKAVSTQEGRVGGW